MEATALDIEQSSRLEQSFARGVGSYLVKGRLQIIYCRYREIDWRAETVGRRNDGISIVGDANRPN